MRVRKSGHAACAALLLAAHAVAAAAETSTIGSATSAAQAEQAKPVLPPSKVCEKIDAAPGPESVADMLMRADCYDRVGRTASAWTLFRETASRAHLEGDAEGHQLAAARMENLEKRLSRLSLKVHPRARLDLVDVRVNGVLIPRASLDKPIPLDAGPQRIDAAAAGHVAWSTMIDVSEGPAEIALEIPALRVKSDALTPEVAATPLPATGLNAPGNMQRAIGYVVGGLGVVGLATGGVFGYRAFDFNQKSVDQCRTDDPGSCTAEGKDRRDQAKMFASGATIGLAAGVALLVSGIALVVRAPRGEAPRRLVSDLRLTAVPSLKGANLRLVGVWQ